jgi:hypothetical protein
MIGNTMTAARRQRKLCLFCLTLRLTLAVVLASSLPGLIGAAMAEYIVVDRHTGLAISGFDPVAYFTEGAPILGKGEFEYQWEGAVWRFRNEGNRAAFIADPDVYMPRFGGYDPVGVTRGVGVPGDPTIWLVTGERLYLFFTLGARAAFVRQPEEVNATADRNWPSVQLTLLPLGP